MYVNRLNEGPLIPKETITHRLQALKSTRRGVRKEGEGISFIAIAKFLKVDRKNIQDAAGGLITNPMHLRLSKMFARMDAGELSFTYTHAMGWQPVFHHPPRVIKQEVTMQVSLDNGKSKLTIHP